MERSSSETTTQRSHIRSWCSNNRSCAPPFIITTAVSTTTTTKCFTVLRTNLVAWNDTTDERWLLRYSSWVVQVSVVIIINIIISTIVTFIPIDKSSTVHQPRQAIHPMECRSFRPIARIRVIIIIIIISPSPATTVIQRQCTTRTRYRCRHQATSHQDEERSHEKRSDLHSLSSSQNI